MFLLPPPIQKRDLILIAAGFGLISVWVLIRFQFNAYPFEDAAILMRYADHVSRGLGVVWNPGEAPVDGATDFLSMMSIAGLAKLGLSIEIATRALGFASLASLLLVLYLTIRIVIGGSSLLSFVSMLLVGFGPGLRYIEAYFTTPFFAFWILLIWAIALSIIIHGPSRRTSILFALFGVFASLTRPEGVFFTAFTALPVLLAIKQSRRPQLIGWVIFLFFLIGGSYFLWHWDTFQYPLPNPFYRKGGGTLHIDSLIASWKNGVLLGLPYVGAFLGLFTKKHCRRILLAALPIVGFLSIWVLLTNEMNFLMRFQYPLFSVMALTFAWIVHDLPSEITFLRPDHFKKREMVVSKALGGVFVIGMIIFELTIGSWQPLHHDGRYDVAKILWDYRDLGYRLATTETGLLPFYSNWQSLDIWGLNDAWLAHHGGKITLTYLQEQDPDVIMAHGYDSPIVPPSTATDQWSEMVRTIQQYAHQKSYSLIASFGVAPDESHYYWVKSENPHAEEISARIRSLPYAWGSDGKTAYNFALWSSQ